MRLPSLWTALGWGAGACRCLHDSFYAVQAYLLFLKTISTKPSHHASSPGTHIAGKSHVSSISVATLHPGTECVCWHLIASCNCSMLLSMHATDSVYQTHCYGNVACIGRDKLPGSSLCHTLFHKETSARPTAARLRLLCLQMLLLMQSWYCCHTAIGMA